MRDLGCKGKLYFNRKFIF
jgi:hypothetical protein